MKVFPREIACGADDHVVFRFQGDVAAMESYMRGSSVYGPVAVTTGLRQRDPRARGVP